MIKINLGCGNDIKEGYINLDARKTHPSVVVGDVTNISQYPNNHFDEILAKDIYEHVTFRQSKSLLSHWVSKLKPGGKITIITPCIRDIIKGFQKYDNDISMLEHYINKLFGGQGYKENFHFTTGHPLLMERYLREAGIKGEIEIHESQDVHHDNKEINLTNMKVVATK